MRHLLTTASLAALIASFGIASAQTPPAQPGAQQQQQQRQQPSGGEERQRQPGQAQQEQRQPGQAQQQRGEERPGQAQQRGEERQPGQAQQQRGEERQRQPGQAQDQQQQRQQPSTAQPSQQPGTQQRQPSQAQDQQRQQPSTAQPSTQQRQPGQAQDQQQRQQPSTAQPQPQQQPGSAQQPAQAQQQPAGSGEVSARIASNPEIQTRIQQSVTSIRATDVNVQVRVGASIPRTIELQPVPQAIIEIAPRYREYRVIRVRDEIVIVNPQSYEVVEVIRIGGGARVGSPAGRAQIQLSAQQRQLILRHAREARTTRTTTTVRVTEGQPLTERVELEAIPQEIITEVPTLREYRYFVSGDQVVIVDPSTNVVTEVIR